MRQILNGQELTDINVIESDPSLGRVGDVYVLLPQQQKNFIMIPNSELNNTRREERRLQLVAEPTSNNVGLIPAFGIPVIILIEPQMGENIGAAARAMKNFGLSEMRIVSPRDGWPNPKADSMSVGAIDIIQNATIYDNVKTAIEDIEFLYATTAVERSINKDYVMSDEISVSYPAGQKVGIMFGRENCGLTNEEISYANMILSIRTDPDFSSLNIAHAVAIVAHEIFNCQSLRRDDNSQLIPIIDQSNTRSANVEERKPILNRCAQEIMQCDVVGDRYRIGINPQILATRGELEYFFEHLFLELDAHKFFKVPEKYPHMSQNIRNIFTRIDKLSKNELQTLRGIVTSLTQK